MNRREYLSITSVCGIGMMAGCLGDDEDEKYSGDAEQLVLESDGLPVEGWTTHQEREPNFEPPSMESGHVIEHVDPDEERGIVTVVLVFNSIEDSKEFYNDQRSQIESDAETTDQDFGDESHLASEEGYTFVEIRESNVWIQVYGNAHRTTIKAVAEEQLGTVTSAEGWD